MERRSTLLFRGAVVHAPVRGQVSGFTRVRESSLELGRAQLALHEDALVGVQDGMICIWVESASDEGALAAEIRLGVPCEHL